MDLMTRIVALGTSINVKNIVVCERITTVLVNLLVKLADVLGTSIDSSEPQLNIVFREAKLE